MLCLVANETGWELNYIKNLPLFQVLQYLAFTLNWQGNEIKWKNRDKASKRKLDKILGIGG